MNESLMRLLPPERKLTVLAPGGGDELLRASFELKAKTCAIDLAFADLGVQRRQRTARR